MWNDFLFHDGACVQVGYGLLCLIDSSQTALNGGCVLLFGGATEKERWMKWLLIRGPRMFYVWCFSLRDNDLVLVGCIMGRQEKGLTCSECVWGELFVKTLHNGLVSEWLGGQGEETGKWSSHSVGDKWYARLILVNLRWSQTPQVHWDGIEHFIRCHMLLHDAFCWQYIFVYDHG